LKGRNCGPFPFQAAGPASVTASPKQITLLRKRLIRQISHKFEFNAQDFPIFPVEEVLGSRQATAEKNKSNLIKFFPVSPDKPATGLEPEPRIALKGELTWHQ
jgi:hypothetical protein